MRMRVRARTRQQAVETQLDGEALQPQRGGQHKQPQDERLRAVKCTWLTATAHTFTHTVAR